MPIKSENQYVTWTLRVSIETGPDDDALQLLKDSLYYAGLDFTDICEVSRT